MTPLPPKATFGDVLDRTQELLNTLAVQCRIADPDQTLWWGQPSQEMLLRFGRFASRISPADRAAPPLTVQMPVRAIVILALLNMGITTALVAREQQQPRSPSALLPEQAEAIAELLVQMEMFSRQTYEALLVGATGPLSLQAVTRASIYFAPLADMFPAALRGDSDAAERVLQLAGDIVAAAEAGIIPAPTLDEGGAQ